MESVCTTISITLTSSRFLSLLHSRSLRRDALRFSLNESLLYFPWSFPLVHHRLDTGAGLLDTTHRYTAQDLPTNTTHRVSTMLLLDRTGPLLLTTLQQSGSHVSRTIPISSCHTRIYGLSISFRYPQPQYVWVVTLVFARVNFHPGYYTISHPTSKWPHSTSQDPHSRSRTGARVQAKNPPQSVVEQLQPSRTCTTCL